ncbi:beta-N-acetylhexosaminidase [Nakamurella lactea]|uniref:beta-N-acetylhexosaminidase n=1 Tax=Nakamurella lactea TaxID=459515 RepID=UPI000420A899|nr:beta-N-acetylhexosaminidase [Nakamurella lactea]
MTTTRLPRDLVAAAESVLLPCFDGTTAPDWVRRRLSESLGGVCLFARNVRDDEQVRELTLSLRAERDELVVAIDEEAGDVTRLDAPTGSPYPGAATLGRLDEPQLTRSVGYLVGRRLSAAGVTLNFAPCADVASDPANPVIGTRSYGPDPVLVARHTAAYIQGQQAAGVAACAKHFPGHGATDTDSHLDVATLAGDLELFRAGDLLPFAAAIGAGVAAVMSGHLLVPAVDHRPATVSPRWLTEILRGEMGFDGVIVSDALEMRAISGPDGASGIPDGAVAALAAGADLLCLGGRPHSAELLDAITTAVIDAVHEGRLAEQRLFDAAARVRTLSTTPPAAPAATPAAVNLSAAARRALQIAGPLPQWSEPVLVLRCEGTPNIAVGDIPWGPVSIGAAVDEREYGPDSRPPEADLRSAGTVIVLTRDRHRHRWMRDLLATVRTVRPDAVLLELGLTGVEAALAPAVAGYGATMVNTRAALDALGAPVDGSQ